MKHRNLILHAGTSWTHGFLGKLIWVAGLCFGLAALPCHAFVPPPTGAVVYSIVSCNSGAVAAGTVITPTMVLPPATYRVRVSYPGDANYNATTADVTWVIANPVSLTTVNNTASPVTVAFGQKPTVTGYSADKDKLLVSQTLDYSSDNGNTWVNSGVTWNGGPQADDYLAWQIPASIFGSKFGAWKVRAWAANNVGFTSLNTTNIVTINYTKATPVATNWSNHTFTFSGNSYAVPVSSLGAAFTNPYNSSVAQPTGTVTYTVYPDTTSPVAAGTVLLPGTYTIRAYYPGDANYNAATADVTWTINNFVGSGNDSTGDGIPNGQKTSNTYTTAINDVGMKVPGGWPLLAAADPNNAHAVGITTGSISVDKSGTASYSIPLYACPGTGGMEPKLSLNYSSSAGAGLLGYGWSLSGTSTITRGGQSAEVDGNGSAVDGNGHSTYVHGMNFALTDRYYLDGQRLIAINGPDGGDGTEYRTETDSFSRIVSYGSDANGTGPAYFKVWTKAGLIMEFGNTPDSAFAPQSPGGTFLSWAVDKISDTKSNYMTFTYSNAPNPGEQYITEIDYTGNAAAGLQPYNSIRFTYTTRQDLSSGFVHGATLSRTKIMTGIGAYNGSSLIHSYLLDYTNRPITNRSILADIREIGSDGREYPPLTFDYWNPPSGWEQSDEVSSTWTPPVALAMASGIQQGVGFIDLNGDGRPDLVRAPDDGTRGAWLNTPGGWVAADGSVPGVPDWRLPVPLVDSALAGYGIPSPAHFVDLNADGRPDLMYWGNAYMNTGSGWAQSNEWSLPPTPPGVGSYNRSTINYVDLNGDGLPDCFGTGYYIDDSTANQCGGLPQTVIVDEAWINLGPNKIDPTTGTHWQWAPEYIVPFADTTMAVMDVNGDGLPDAVESDLYVSTPWNHYGNGSNINYCAVAINTGSGFNVLQPGSDDFNRYAPPVPLHMISDFVGPIGTEAADLNGDGLPDLISWDYANRSPRATYFNTGYGWVLDASSYTAPYQMWDTGQNAPTGVALLDVNGSGTPDFVLHYGDQTDGAWLNTGSGWSQQVSADYVPPRAIAHPATKGHAAGSDFVDLNGTGALDEVWNFNGDTGGAAINHRFNVDRLTKVTTGMGVSTSITYKPLTDPTVYTKGTSATYPEQDVIGPMYVVSEVDSDDGVGGQNAMTYAYAGLRSSLIHGSEGFASMTVTELRSDGRTGTSTVTNYRQDYPFIGMASSSIGKLGSQVLTESKTTWVDQGSYANVHFPYASQGELYSYELNGAFVSGTSTSTVYSTDGYGNALTVDVESINADGSPTGYEKITTSTYDNIITSDNWFLGRLRRAQTTSSAPGVPAITRTSAFAYDSGSGLLTQEIVEPDDGSTTDPQKLTTTYTYDAFGNKTSATTSGVGFADRMVVTAYDSRGQFPVSTTNALGHHETYIYNPAWGVMTSQTGPNNLTTTWNYDGMGRKITENRPDGTSTYINYRWAGSNAPPVPAGAASIAYLIETETSGAPPSLAFYDKMGRAIYAFGLNGGDFNGNPRIVGSQTQYDSMSRAFWTSRPFYYLDTPVEAGSVTDYDLLNRPLQQRSADEEVSGGFVYSTFEYDGLVTKATNPKGQVTVSTKNSQGQLLSVVTNAGAVISAPDRGETDYFYDAAGDVLSTKVLNNNGSVVETDFTYDLSGRKIQMTDPDMGVWKYTYDAAGELISQTDAKGQTATMAYDQLGRLVTRSEAEGNTTWTYDTAPRGGGVWLGALASVTAPNNYSESYTYDPLGRPSVTTCNINTGSTTEPFTVGQQYDAFSRPTIATYPYGYQVEKVYNDYGFLTEVRQASASTGLTNDTTQGQVFWQADSYSIFGGVNGCTYGNGITEDTILAASTGRVLGFGIGVNEGVAYYGYTHDALGNLTNRTDQATNRTETYTYDGLNRLTSTALTVSFGGLGTSNTVSVGYDSLGNIVKKDGVGAYTYGQNGAGPHAVTSAGGNSYHYDANGNMVSGSVLVGGAPSPRSIAWTSFNQVKSITQGSHSSTFTFDSDHQRATQTTEHGTTVYVGSAFERVTNASDVQYKFYIFTPAGRSVVRTVDAGTVTTRYLHQDVLGSIVAVTDEDGDAVERYAYDPWGKQTSLPAASGTPAVSLPNPSNATTRGFTDHEMLSDLGLIHMNGRVYDPVLGRFLSADSVVQAPGDSQAYNRYSYCSNNPVNAIDPSGHSWFSKLFKNLFALSNFGPAYFFDEKFFNQYGSVGLSTGAYIAGTIIGAYFDMPWLGAVASGFVSGFSSSILNNGSIGDAFRNGAIGAAEGFIGFYAGPEAAAIANGFVSEAEGGEFSNGFWPGLVQAEISSLGALGGGNFYVQFAANVVGGGTGSVVGGGKFANGAETAAFEYVGDYVGTHWHQTVQELGFRSESKSMSQFKAHSAWWHWGSRAKTDGMFDAEVNQTIGGIRDALVDRAISLDPTAPQALAALFNFEVNFAKYTDAITINEFSGSGEADPTVPGKAIVNWDPNYSDEANGITSSPKVLFAHELTHAFNHLSLPISAQLFMQNTTAGSYGNLSEMDAMVFENLVRPVGSPPRTSHDPNNPGGW
jgi:RHS repeat-associated protein